MNRHRIKEAVSSTILNLRTMIHMLKLRGADSQFVAIQPDVAIAVVWLSLTLEGVGSSLRVEEGLDFVNHRQRDRNMHREMNVPINSAADIVTARQKGRAFAIQVGFTGSDLALISTAISEVARNIFTHAKRGEVVLSSVQQGSQPGVCVIATDEGPGIADIELAMQYGFSTHQGLGVGLPGAQLLMDDFGIESQVGKGTIVTMKKWLPA